MRNKFIYIALLLISNTIFAAADSLEWWMQNYYANPQPQLFVKNTELLCKAGALKNPDSCGGIIVFLSQVMKQNPDEIKNWLDGLKNEDKEDLDKIYEAAFLSNTNEAENYFKNHNIRVYLNKPSINILNLPMSIPQILDWMWAYFFATGEKSPIEKIVSVLNYAKYKGCVDAYKNSNKTEEDRKKAIFDAMFQSALWSLQVNAKKHELVKKYLEEILKSKMLTKDEHLWLFFVLSKVDPQKYRFELKNVAPL